MHVHMYTDIIALLERMATEDRDAQISIKNKLLWVGFSCLSKPMIQFQADAQRNLAREKVGYFPHENKSLYRKICS